MRLGGLSLKTTTREVTTKRQTSKRKATDKEKAISDIPNPEAPAATQIQEHPQSGSRFLGKHGVGEPSSETRPFVLYKALLFTYIRESGMVASSRDISFFYVHRAILEANSSDEFGGALDLSDSTVTYGTPNQTTLFAPLLTWHTFSSRTSVPDLLSPIYPVSTFEGPAEQYLMPSDQAATDPGTPGLRLATRSADHLSGPHLHHQHYFPSVLSIKDESSGAARPSRC